MKDEKKEDWPILGICQGLEVISIILGDDDINTIEIIDIYGRNLPIKWVDEDSNKNSKFFSKFPQEIIEKMENTGLALHAHTFSVSVDTFN
jgi:gamma-glutamyl-gamma-aminobutyrate hydrolase PuuD